MSDQHHQWGDLKLLRIIGVIFVGSVLCLWFQIPVGVAKEMTGAKAIFSEAQTVFNSGLTRRGERKRLAMLKAAGLFESLVTDYKLENGYLYYNIGNCYYEAGEKGRAILNYRRAELLVPGFPDLRNNLSQTRHELKLTVESKNWWSDVGKSVLFWHFALDYSTRRLIFYSLFVMLWIILTGLIFFRHLFLKAGLVLVVFGVLCFGGSYLYSSYQLYFVESGVIVSRTSEVRKGPGYGYEKFYEQSLPGGTEFAVTEKLGEWWKITLKNGDSVWIRREDVELI
jgi:tetratricopeptide (TPR) repeat protein